MHNNEVCCCRKYFLMKLVERFYADFITRDKGLLKNFYQSPHRKAKGSVGYFIQTYSILLIAPLSSIDYVLASFKGNKVF